MILTILRKGLSLYLYPKREIIQKNLFFFGLKIIGHIHVTQSLILRQEKDIYKILGYDSSILKKNICIICQKLHVKPYCYPEA